MMLGDLIAESSPAINLRQSALEGVLVLSSELAAVGALLTSLFSLWISVRGQYTARRALRISEMEYQEKYKEVIGYLIDGFRWAEGGKDYVNHEHVESVAARFASEYAPNEEPPHYFIDSETFKEFS